MKYSHSVQITDKNHNCLWFQNGSPTLYPDRTKNFRNYKDFRTAKKLNQFLRGLADAGFDGFAYVDDFSRNTIFVVSLKEF